MSPATSKSQRALFCIAMSMKQGKTPKSYSKQAARLAQTMSEQQLRDYCESPLRRK